MLTSPIVFTLGGVNHNLVRINNDNFTSIYLKKWTASGIAYELRLAIRHSYEGKAGAAQYERHNVDVTYSTWDTDKNLTVRQAYMVVRNPRGADNAPAEDLGEGLSALATANLTALLNWES